MVDSWDICTTWNAHKEGGLMAITFFNSWIWITCIPLMVNICDKKRHSMLFILPYFHDGQIHPGLVKALPRSLNRRRMAASMALGDYRYILRARRPECKKTRVNPIRVSLCPTGTNYFSFDTRYLRVDVLFYTETPVMNSSIFSYL